MHKVCRAMRNVLIGLSIMLMLYIPSIGFTREVNPKKYEKYLPSGNYQYQYGWGVIYGTITSKKTTNGANYIQVVNNNAPDISESLMIIEETTYEGATSYDDLKVGIDVVVDYTWIKIAYNNIEINMADVVSVPSMIKRSKEEEFYLEAVPHFNACSAYSKEQCEKAIMLYTKALAINSNYVKAYIDRASMYSKLGKVDKALQDYNKAISLDPKNGMNYYERGQFYLSIKRCDKAIADFNKEFAINSNTDYSQRGQAYYCAKKYKEAIDYFSVVISELLAEAKNIGEDPTRNPGWGNLAIQYFYRGAAYVKYGNKENGLNDFRNALAIDPSFERHYQSGESFKPLFADKDIRKFFNLATGLAK